MDEITLDRAMLYGILQANDTAAYFRAREHGVEPEHVLDEDQKVFAFMGQFVRSGRLPTVIEIKAKTGVSLIVPDSSIEPFDVDVFAGQIQRRALQNAMKDPFGEIATLIVTDPFEARKKMSQLVRETAWSLGKVASYADPALAQETLGDYERARDNAGELLGLSSPWLDVDKYSLGLQPGELTVLLAKRKVGKSIPDYTPMYDPRTGMETTLREVVADRAFVLTWEKRGPIAVARPSDYLDSGTKDCLRLTWRSGRTLDTSKDHPFLAPRGWVPAVELEVGQHTGAAAVIPEPTEAAPAAPETLIVLAYMIAEGGCTKPSTPSFTSSVPEIVAEMSETLARSGHKLSPRGDGDYYVTTEHGGRNGIVELLRNNNLLGKKDIDKTIPPGIFSLPTAQLGLFIGRLWSCDGCVGKRGQVSYSTGSQKMAEQIQHLLLRFGVTSHLRTMPRETEDGPRDYYEVIVHRERIERFKRHVQLVGPKAEALEQVKFQGRSRIGWIRNEELRDEICAEMDARPDLLPEVGEELGYGFKFQKGHVFDSKSGRIRRRVFSAFCEVYDSPLVWVLDENIQWDEIVKIEEIGPRPCLDIAVPGTECFLAGDIITHNTWLMLVWFMHILRSKKDLKPGECLLVVSMEMPKKQIYRRLAAIDLLLNYQGFRSGKLTSEEERRLQDHVKSIMTPDPTRKDIHIACADVVRDVSDICDKVAELNPKAVAIDGMYILGRDRRMGMWERTIQNCAEIKLDLCSEMNVPVLATTQFRGTKSKHALEADADDAAYAKAIGDWADAMRGIFMDEDHERIGKRVFRAMESREFRGVDIQIAFNLATMDFSQIKIMDDNKSAAGANGEGGGGVGAAPDPDAEPTPIVSGLPDGSVPEAQVASAPETLEADNEGADTDEPLGPGGEAPPSPEEGGIPF